MVMDDPLQWPKWLTPAEWWYNTTFHSAIGMSPFEALYGIPHDTKLHSLEEWFQQREIKLFALKTNLAKAKNKMKQMADKRLSEREFKVGDWVYVKLQSYVQNSLKDHRNKKLILASMGPPTTVTPLPDSPRFVVQPRAILDCQFVKKGSKEGVKVLVHWESLPITEVT
ncbi:uncharacterized protein LOC143605771 [Bidens hawaiensis]|uniref:uncharacterized protein LOC143605771 n=1 Tax=Bidens hawaiensis TaxID=980011 RepID=UPI00404B51CC